LVQFIRPGQITTLVICELWLVFPAHFLISYQNKSGLYRCFYHLSQRDLVLHTWRVFGTIVEQSRNF